MPGRFTRQDRERAGRALGTYVVEFGDPRRDGFGAEFNGLPGAMRLVTAWIPAHRASLGRFQLRVQLLGEFAEILEGFLGRSVWVLNPARDKPGEPAVIPYHLEAQQVRTYRQMHEALQAYTDALKLSRGWGWWRSLNQPAVMAAAEAVAGTLNPEAWRREGARLPEDVVPLTNNALTYLMAVYTAPIL